MASPTSFPAWVVESVDGAVHGRLRSLEVEALSPGDVLLEAAWSSVNYKDALAATGRGRLIRQFPMVPGIDVCGRVLESSDARWRPGQWVIATGHELGTGHTGGYAGRVRVPADWLVALPADLSPREAMLLGTAGFTVGLAVDRLFDNHQTPELGPLLVTGATGGVGSLAVNVLSRLGFEVIALTGKSGQEGYLEGLGASEVWQRDGLTLGSGPLESARLGGGVDNLGGEVLSWMLRSTRPWGNVVTVGLAASAELSVGVMPFILRGVSLLGVTASNCPTGRRAAVWERLAGAWRPARLEDTLAGEIGLEELPMAFLCLLEGRVRGRWLVRLPGAERADRPRA
jgi:putative YhdH/YhfP family quinone oxidoreductase